MIRDGHGERYNLVAPGPPEPRHNMGLAGGNLARTQVQRLPHENREPIDISLCGVGDLRRCRATGATGLPRVRSGGERGNHAATDQGIRSSVSR